MLALVPMCRRVSQGHPSLVHAMHPCSIYLALTCGTGWAGGRGGGRGAIPGASRSVPAASPCPGSRESKQCLRKSITGVRPPKRGGCCPGAWHGGVSPTPGRARLPPALSTVPFCSLWMGWTGRRCTQRHTSHCQCSPTGVRHPIWAGHRPHKDPTAADIPPIKAQLGPQNALDPRFWTHFGLQPHGQGSYLPAPVWPPQPHQGPPCPHPSPPKGCMWG